MKKFKIGIIGAGNWGANYVRILSKLGFLGAVADSRESITKDFKKKYPDVLITENYLEILKDSFINGVVVASPAHTHYEIVKNCLKVGKDVLVEKPMTLCVQDARELAAIAESMDKILMVGHLLLYKPAVKKMIECVRKQVIGEIYFVEMNRLKLGKVRSRENVLWSFAPHDIAVLLSLVDSEVEQVTSVGTSAIQSMVEDDVYLHIKFKNGVKASVHLSWLWPCDQRKTIIVGSRGMICYEENIEKLTIYRKGISNDLTIWDEGNEVLEFDKIDVLEIEVLHFIECIEKRIIPDTEGKSGARVIKLLTDAEAQLKKPPW
ncbi:Gfo/Idh/MocA family protein [Candidatus Contubernalis alkaliaceticus]|uniref:Gfo/Idh/MocA family protein n=1 Tax=Candidatus Contubernalis alkaliaceticus TaxID=338645 RepID=UPI001F4C235D|nr:Gfo/Idh/MocA family oxidoreductase [Candidatus Contubernalis alkalaceticus]UNC92307.1 Gfo/Idh/MocA family oxidoreductase [Candidatus Contubernalis alkalaceticus]